MSTSNPFVLTFVRLTLACIAVMHGLANGFGLFGGSQIEGFASNLSAEVSTGSGTIVPVWATLELLVGICLLLGSFARAAAGVGLGLLLVLVIFDHRYAAFWATNKGLEFPLALIALCLVTLTQGPGACCFDVRAAIKKFRERSKVKP